MQYYLQELKQIMKDNGIKGSSFMLTSEIVKLLKEKNLIPETKIILPTPQKVTDPKYDHLKHPRKVTVKNIETGEIITYPSIYRAGRSLQKFPRSILYFNGKIMDKKYNMTIWKRINCDNY